MRRYFGVLLAGVLLSGLLAGTAAADGELAFDLSVDGCISETGTATINLEIENLTDGSLNVWGVFMNRATAASPPLWRWWPWYELQEFDIEAYGTTTASFDVVPETRQYLMWVVMAWVGQPWYSANNRFHEPYLSIPECVTKAEQLMQSGVPGLGLTNAPGLDQPFNDRSSAPEHAGMD